MAPYSEKITDISVNQNVIRVTMVMMLGESEITRHNYNESLNLNGVPIEDQINSKIKTFRNSFSSICKQKARDIKQALAGFDDRH